MEIHNYQAKRDVLVTIRYNMAHGIPPTKALYDAFRAIPREEVEYIGQVMAFFDDDTPKSKKRTYADVVKNGT